MTEEELAKIEAGGRGCYECGALTSNEDAARLIAEIRRLRVLPVLVTCADCAHRTPRNDEGLTFGELFRCRGTRPHRALPTEDVIPEWCPLKHK